MTRYDTYVGDAEEQHAFRKYTKKHYDSWVTFARSKQYGYDVQPVLVSGFDLTKDFAMAAYSNDDASLESALTLSIPMFASASASIYGTWQTKVLPHTKCGPRQCVPDRFSQSAHGSPGPGSVGNISDDYKQCVFVRYYTMRKEMGVYPRVIRASAGPHDLGPGHNHDSTFSELTARQVLTPDDEDDPMGGEERGPITGEACSDQDIVVCNVPDVWHT